MKIKKIRVKISLKFQTIFNRFFKKIQIKILKASNKNFNNKKIFLMKKYYQHKKNKKKFVLQGLKKQNKFLTKENKILSTNLTLKNLLFISKNLAQKFSNIQIFNKKFKIQNGLSLPKLVIKN